jgi:hypothetical protein
MKSLKKKEYHLDFSWIKKLPEVFIIDDISIDIDPKFMKLLNKLIDKR